jgi:hypothetical protein
MTRSASIAFASVVLLLGVAACGSSEKRGSAATAASSTAPPPAVSTPTTTANTLEASFIARVNAVCARAKATIGAHGKFPYPTFDPLHPDVKLLPKVGAFFATTQATSDRVPRELRKLGNPATGQGEWTQLVALATQSRLIADRQIAAAKASNVPAFIATVHAVQANEARLGQVGSASGFNSASPCNAVL